MKVTGITWQKQSTRHTNIQQPSSLAAFHPIDPSSSISSLTLPRAHHWHSPWVGQVASKDLGPSAPYPPLHSFHHTHSPTRILLITVSFHHFQLMLLDYQEVYSILLSFDKHSKLICMLANKLLLCI